MTHHHLKYTTLTPQPHNHSPPLFPNLGRTTCLQRRRRRRPGRTVMGGIHTCRLAHLLGQSVPIRYGKIGVLFYNLRAGIGIVASLAADTADPLGTLEPLAPRLLADVAACGSTLLPGWSSVATTRTAATALTITIFPRSPPILLFIAADITAFFSAASAISPLRSRSKKSRVGRFRLFLLF